MFPARDNWIVTGCVGRLRGKERIGLSLNHPDLPKQKLKAVQFAKNLSLHKPGRRASITRAQSIKPRAPILKRRLAVLDPLQKEQSLGAIDD